MVQIIIHVLMCNNSCGEEGAAWALLRAQTAAAKLYSVHLGRNVGAKLCSISFCLAVAASMILPVCSPPKNLRVLPRARRQTCTDLGDERNWTFRPDVLRPRCSLHTPAPPSLTIRRSGCREVVCRLWTHPHSVFVKIGSAKAADRNKSRPQVWFLTSVYMKIDPDRSSCRSYFYQRLPPPQTRVYIHFLIFCI